MNFVFWGIWPHFCCNLERSFLKLTHWKSEGEEEGSEGEEEGSEGEEEGSEGEEEGSELFHCVTFKQISKFQRKWLIFFVQYFYDLTKKKKLFCLQVGISPLNLFAFYMILIEFDLIDKQNHLSHLIGRKTVFFFKNKSILFQEKKLLENIPIILFPLIFLLFFE